MRRTWRNRLLLLGLLGLLVVALGAAAVAGWLPPLNHWAERRLLAELRVLGMETNATQLRELSWRRAVVGPIELQLPGLVVLAEQARAELGWSVLSGRVAPEVVLSGLVLEVNVDRFTDLRGALQAQGGEFPAGRLTLENSKVVLRRGEQRLELAFSGFIDSRSTELRAELVVTAPALAGRLLVRADSIADLVEFELHDGRLTPAPWRELLVGLAPSVLLALDTAPDASLQFSGEAEFVSSRLRTAKVDVALPGLLWRSEGQQADLAAASLQFGCEPDGKWRLEVRTSAAAWQQGDLAAGLTDLDFVVEPGNAQLRFGGGRAVAAGVELLVRGRLEARWRDVITAATAEAELTIESVAGAEWQLHSPCELAARWNGSDLALTIPLVALAKPRAVQIQAVEATVGGLLTEHPVMTARAAVAAAPLALFDVPELSMQPAEVAAQLALTAGLARGQEGVRVEWTVPQQRRVFAWEGGKAEAAIGAEGILNLDRSYASGRSTVELRSLSAAGEQWSAAAQAATFNVRWPRLWLESLRGWSGLSGERLIRELAWAGDYDAKLSGGLGRFGRDGRVGGVDLRASSRGAELFETGGADFGASVTEIVVGPRRLLDGTVQATFGLEGGAVQGGIALAGLSVRPTIVQTLRWGDSITAEGTFGFGPAQLTGTEPWGQWWPALADGKFSGGLELRGQSRLADGAWSFSAEMLLQNFAAAWPAQAFTLEQINGTLAVPDLATLRSAPAQRFTVGRGDLAGVELTNAMVEFALDGPERVQVDKFEVGAFGGRLATAAFEFDPRRPEPAFQLRLTGARLEQLLELFDDVPAEADGPVDGELPLAWTGGQLHMGTGFFMLTAGEFGRVRFTRNLHLLTSGRSPNSLGYGALLEIESSIQQLHFNRLRIDTYPKDAPGQSLRIRMVGAPAGGTVATPVHLDVNVNAPLEHFLNWGRRREGAALPAR